MAEPEGTSGFRLGLAMVPAAGLVLGLGLMAFGWGEAAGWIFAGATLPVLLVLLRDIARGLFTGDVGLDLIAALSMAGALALGEPLAGVVVGLMFAGGQFLEAYARRRARREMTALLERLPRNATRHGPAGLETVPIAALRPGDLVLIRQGEVVPVDGRLASPLAVLDTSALTGESVPVRAGAGDSVQSGVMNAGEAFDVTAEKPASESTYAGILRLVEGAQASKAPMARLADRWALGFLLLTLVLSGGAWAISGDATRALAVLVVATPCPLILAVPVALIAGLSRAAQAGVLIKNGGALETLARARVLLLDKTGTLTEGRPRLVAIHPAPGVDPDEVLRLAASLDQVSTHVVAQALVAAARERHLALVLPAAVREAAGAGVSGIVEGREVSVGGEGFVRAAIRGTDGARPDEAQPVVSEGGASAIAAAAPGALRVSVAVDGVPAGVLVLADRLRADAGAMLAAARRAGIRRVVMLSGDQPEIAEAVARGLDLDAVRGGLSPSDKLAAVRAERAAAAGDGTVIMVGDGVNDAPALAAADAGVAMGARGAAASAEAADAVLLVDRLDRLAEAMRVARRARGIALQSVAAGIGLSTVGMLAAAAGLLTPVEGAILQEAIDVAVILNALRALRG
jgi:heavy metal translocating P-type ATPase